MNAETPGQALLKALVALGWTLTPWEDATESERAGLEEAAQAALVAAPPGWATDYVGRAADAVVEANRDRDDYAARLKAADQAWNRLRLRLDTAEAVLGDIAAADGNDYCGQRARGALKTIRTEA